ncbi:MAG: hypothetical protein K2L79_02820, partial [Bacteroidales bacterium]|nr:hypothetical protein [Bacteroidales bacterium]
MNVGRYGRRVAAAVALAIGLGSCRLPVVAQPRPAGGRLAVERTECYYPLLAGKKVGVVANHASVFYRRPPEMGAFPGFAENAPVPPYTHLVDSLL